MSEEKLLVLVGSAIPGGQHRGPIIGGLQDGEAVCQCLNCGRCWTESGKILDEGSGADSCIDFDEMPLCLP